MAHLEQVCHELGTLLGLLDVLHGQNVDVASTCNEVYYCQYLTSATEQMNLYGFIIKTLVSLALTFLFNKELVLLMCIDTQFYGQTQDGEKYVMKCLEDYGLTL